MVHPGPDGHRRCDVARAGRHRASTFTGREAHASAAPELGRNAADAATVAQVGDRPAAPTPPAGAADPRDRHRRRRPRPTSCPARTEMLYYLRAETAGSLAELTTRAEALFRGGRARDRVHARDPDRVADLHGTDARPVAGRGVS